MLSCHENSETPTITNPVLAGKWRSFAEARTFVRSLKLKSFTQWRTYCAGEMPELATRPADIPSSPGTVYKGNGWVSYPDFLGTNNKRSTTPEGGFRSFEDARAFVRVLKLGSVTKWREYCQGELADLPPKPDDIPRAPNNVYTDTDEWDGWGDFLGTYRRNREGLRSFAKARAFVRRLRLKSHTQWRQYVSGELEGYEPKPIDIPSNPNMTYKGRGWNGYGDFLGNKRRKPAQRGKVRSFAESREFARSLGLKSSYEWKSLYRCGKMPDKPERPDDVPACPDVTYKDSGWAGWGDFLGFTPVIHQWRPFAEAREFARTLGLASANQWSILAKRNAGIGEIALPADIPTLPHVSYAGEFVSYEDFLGVGVAAS